MCTVALMWYKYTCKVNVCLHFHLHIHVLYMYLCVYMHTLFSVCLHWLYLCVHVNVSIFQNFIHDILSCRNGASQSSAFVDLTGSLDQSQLSNRVDLTDYPSEAGQERYTGVGVYSMFAIPHTTSY